MATRRNVNSTEKTITQAQGGPSNTSITSDIRPAVPADVIFKLLAFTFAMVVMPIGSYFFTLKFVFKGNAIWSGAFAAIMANVVLIAYVIVAMSEDESNASSSKSVTGVDVLKRKVESQSQSDGDGTGKKSQ